MVPVLFWPMVVCAGVDWLATWRCWQRVRWVTKPGTLLLLIAWFTAVGGWKGALVWFGAGLVFSLAGDVLLHMPPRVFILGMLAFFLAHAAYIGGFLHERLAPTVLLLIPLAAILVIDLLLFRPILAGLEKRGENQMRNPVTGYAAILSLMLFFALSTLFHSAWTMSAAVLVSLGAALFFLSDSALAYSRFARPIPSGDLLVMVTYHLGQFLIALGALTQFAGYKLFG